MKNIRLLVSLIFLVNITNAYSVEQIVPPIDGYTSIVQYNGNNKGAGLTKESAAWDAIWSRMDSSK